MSLLHSSFVVLRNLVTSFIVISLEFLVNNTVWGSKFENSIKSVIFLSVKNFFS